MGKRLRELREQAGLSRAALSRATGVHVSAIFRLEHGEDVQLSSYLPIVDYFLGRDRSVWAVAERLLLLPDDAREQVSKLVLWFGRASADEGADD